MANGALVLTHGRGMVTDPVGATHVRGLDPGRRQRVAASGVDARLVSLLDPVSFAAEQYRLLGYELEHLRRSRGVSVVVVTSPAAGEGKTTTAINLAETLAQAPDARVLLIDADLRLPQVGARMGLRGTGTGPGLTGAILEPGYELSIVVRHRSPFHFSVLPAGPRSDFSYELLALPRVGALLAEARESYDFVIVDAPPLLLVPDTRALGRWVDGFLMVVAAHLTPRRLLAEALGAAHPEQVLGIVYNHDDNPLAGYYRRYHGYYSELRGLSGKPQALPVSNRPARRSEREARPWRSA